MYATPAVLFAALLLAASIAQPTMIPTAAPISKPTTAAPGPSARPTPQPSRPTTPPTPHPSPRPSPSPTAAPSPQPTLTTYEQLVFELDNVALSCFQVQLARDSVQMALKVALNVSAASVGEPVATAGPPMPAPAPLLLRQRRLAGSAGKSASPTAAPLPTVIITTIITTTNINVGSETQGVVSDTNSAVLLATFQRNTARFLATFLASVTTFDSSPANRLQFASASIPPHSIYVVSLVPTLAPVWVPVATQAPSASIAWSAVEGAAERHKLSIIVGASLGGVLVFLMLCLGCIARPYVVLWCRQQCPICCKEREKDGAQDGNGKGSKAGCCSRLAACLCCLCRCCCKKKAPPLASKAAEAEEEDDEDDEDEDDEEEEDEEEEDEGDNPEGTGMDMTKIYGKQGAPESQAPFTTPTSAAAFNKAAQGGARSSLSKPSTNPLATASLSPARRGSCK